EGHLAVNPLVAQGDGHTMIQISHLAEALSEDIETVVARLHNLKVGQEGGLCAGVILGHRTNSKQGSDRHAALVALAIERAVAFDLHLAPFGERVDHRNAHTVQATADLVAAAAEFASGVQDGHYHLQRREARTLMVFFDGDAAPVVLDRDGAVSVNSHTDSAGKAGHHLVDTIVYYLLDQMVQPALVRRANIHAGTHAHRLQALENLNILFAISAIPIMPIHADLQIAVLCHLSQQGFGIILLCHK